MRREDKIALTGAAGRVGQNLVAAILMIAAIIVLDSSGDPAPGRRLSISLTAEQPSGFQIYFDQGTGFSERESARMNFPTGSGISSVPLPIGAVRALRLDPDPAVNKFQLQKIAIETPSQKRSLELPMAGMSSLRDIEVVEHATTGVFVRVDSGASDAQLLLPVQDAQSTRWMEHVGRASQVLLLLALGTWVVVRLTRPKSGVPISALLLGAWLLVATMALTSTTSRPVHPDEGSHVHAARYYLTHWQPPAVDAPEIVDSYSVYGASYLNELDVVYLIAAKATQFWAGFGLDETAALRMFNVILFGVLLAVAWVRRSTWPGLAVLLLTPQIWYVYSYFNADAFPLFLSLLVALLVAASDSPVARFVEGERVSRLAIALFVLALGLLLVSKRNYLPVVFAAGLGLLVRHLGLSAWGVLLATMGAGLLLFSLVAAEHLVYIFPHTAQWFAPVGLGFLACFAILALWPVLHTPELRPRAYRLAWLLALAVVVAAPRLVADIVVNGTPAQKALRMSMAAQQYGDPRFKPSTLAKNPSAGYPTLNLAAKGASFSQVVGHPHAWAEDSVRSLFGVYGYMNIFAPPLLYWLLGAGFLMLCFSMLRWAFVHADARRGVLVAAAGIGLVVMSSLVHSWANDLQSQGRYFFPGLAIVAAYLLSQPGILQTRFASFAVALCSVGSVLSFAGVALPALADR